MFIHNSLSLQVRERHHCKYENVITTVFDSPTRRRENCVWLQVLSQVLVPPLVQEYVAVKQEWMKQKLWKQEDFIEVLDESCDEEMKPQVIEALHAFLEM